MQHDALGHDYIGGGLAGITLTNIGELNLLAGRVLDIYAQAADRGLIAGIGRCDVKGKHVAERVDGQLYLRAAPTFRAVIASLCPAFGGIA